MIYISRSNLSHNIDIIQMCNSSGSEQIVNSGNDLFPFYSLYRRAAEQLMKDKKMIFTDERDREIWALVKTFTGQEFIPILFLYRHSFELQLKHALGLLDELDDIPKSKEREKELRKHNLKCYAEELSKRIPNHFAEEQSQVLINPISETLSSLLSYFDEFFHKIDPESFTFRYENSKDHEKLPKFDLEIFKNEVTRCADRLDELIKGLVCFLDYKNGRLD